MQTVKRYIIPSEMVGCTTLAKLNQRFLLYHKLTCDDTTLQCKLRKVNTACPVEVEN